MLDGDGGPAGRSLPAGFLSRCSELALQTDEVPALTAELLRQLGDSSALAGTSLFEPAGFLGQLVVLAGAAIGRLASGYLDPKLAVRVLRADVAGVAVCREHEALAEAQGRSVGVSTRGLSSLVVQTSVGCSGGGRDARRGYQL